MERLMSRAAFFDLDRTLVRVNTGPLYVKWRVKQKKMGPLELARVSWWTLQYTFGVLDADKASRAAVASMAGVHEDEFRRECAEWVEAEVLSLVTQAARNEVLRRKVEGRVCALLTTTSPYVADPVARHLDVAHVLSSRMKVEGGRFTGEVDPPLCYGSGKVERALAWAKERDIDLRESAFYTDSVSDLPMLEAVGEPHVVNPDPRLMAIARRRGWPISKWS
jgi:HAD superfamily hydrolase (TIGR01490 family)